MNLQECSFSLTLNVNYADANGDIKESLEDIQYSYILTHIEQSSICQKRIFFVCLI